MNLKNIVVSAVAAAVVAAGVAAWLGKGELLSGGIQTVPQMNPYGIKIGDRWYLSKTLEMKAPDNQMSWCPSNTEDEGKVIYIREVQFTAYASTTAKFNSAYVLDGGTTTPGDATAMTAGAGRGTSSSAVIINYRLDYNRATATPLAIFPSIFIPTSTPDFVISSKQFVEFATTSVIAAKSHGEGTPERYATNVTNVLRAGMGGNSEYGARSLNVIPVRSGECVAFALSSEQYNPNWGAAQAGAPDSASTTPNQTGMDKFFFDIDYYHY